MLDQDLTCCQDPCCTRQPFSILRFSVLALLFLTAIPGTVIFLILLADRPYGIQLSSIVAYTAAAALYTFSSNRGGQPFLLSCPVVRRQLPRLIRRHLGFLAALFILQTTALELRPNLPAYWITPSSTNVSPFALSLGCLCACLTLVQILSNRSLLERAHLSA